MKDGERPRTRGSLTQRWWRVGVLSLSVLIVLLSGVAQLLTPPQLMLFGLVVVGPVLAATAADAPRRPPTPHQRAAREHPP
ncbi:hypothetical protein EV385_6436 [Krasilnikovia cinnamomea]|uniref:DUF3099 family protein n=1 Tax=Krasilnikovia cinnamomea TaxID=349313 RepID=A0A4Q7ZV71_9ACTN|nr:hypothetical protein [Krasilnikovia cinnamomea]RZU54485.1 hypothetical protein EV385_6436 [Krasilnikovia cinnamomea]